MPPADSHCLHLAVDDRVCVCLHALSSFQRTDRSCALGARPTVLPVRLAPDDKLLWGIPFGSHSSRTCRRSPAALSDAARLGEPSKVTSPPNPCQDEISVPCADYCRLRLEGRSRLIATETGRVSTDRTFKQYPVPRTTRQAGPPHRQPTTFTRCCFFAPRRNTNSRPSIAVSRVTFA